MNPATGTSVTYTETNRLSPCKIAEIAVIGALLAAIYTFFGTFEHLWMDWNSPSIDRTYNMVIPVFSVVFVWLKWKRIKAAPIKATFWGLPMVLFGMGTRLLAEPGQVNFVKYTSLIFLLGGAVWMIFGNRMFKELLFPIAFLIFMMPVPDPIYQRMSVPLMDFAAKAGFAVTRLVGVDAILGGRKITILAAGALKEDLPMSVAEACSGMKSLVTLGAVAVAFAYITRRDLLTRIIISLSSIPIAIVMNMLRVGGVGVLAVRLGPEAAGGFIHEAQGAVFYIVEIVLLFLAGSLISWIFGKPTVEWGRADAPDNPGGASYPYSTRISAPAVTCMVVLAIMFPALSLYHDRVKHLSAGLEPKISLDKFTNSQREYYEHGMLKAYFHMLGRDKTAGIDTDLSSGDVQYVGIEEEIGNEELKTAETDEYVNIVYYECPKGVNPRDVEKTSNYMLGYVAFHKSASNGVNRGGVHYPDQCYPGNGYTTAATGIVRIDTPGYCGGAADMSRSIFYDEKGYWILVYYHMNNNGRAIVDRSTGKIDNFFKLLLGQRAGFLAQVQFYTVIGHGNSQPGGISEDKIKSAEERLKRFCPLFLEKLGRYLPDPVK